MDLCRDIARALPQHVSRADRPIVAQDGRPLPPGWINERVNTSDWDNNLGGVFYGSTWCEVSLLLTAVELPGVYALRDTREVWALDNVEAAWREGELVVSNPTKFPARVRVLIEDAASRARPLGQNAALAWPVVGIPPGGEARIR